MMTTGASLKPDSASRMPLTDRGSGTLRSTEKTAAASVEDRIAPTSIDCCHGSPKAKSTAPATTSTETTTPIVESAAAGPTLERMCSHEVVSPPSMRMSTSAAYPRTIVRAVFSQSMPMTPSPSTSPIPR